jgi:hypothetical protein
MSRRLAKVISKGVKPTKYQPVELYTQSALFRGYNHIKRDILPKIYMWSQFICGLCTSSLSTASS